MSREEFDNLTDKEKMFIKKEHENKFISDTTWLRNAVLNAEANINRGKNKKFLELFPRKQVANKEYNENAIKNIIEMEETNGKSWVDRIYKANGMKKPISKERRK
ncbi:phenylalanine racemase [Bacillus sp. CH30_1T]|uniref:phenylalanine racemase n=1 Tax=Bacillus sp. CH30_1T TaxID=2604836 RepID=UPI0011EC62F9|nr:phenylalanine racemase [Bacillus sp. CH30_1T]KAA0565344.1 phenylalanine racemase [Bacillus sp. CH30_1T]